MEIPYDDGRILFKRDPVSRGYTAEGGNALTVQAACLFINRIIIHVIKETCHKGKRPVGKFLYKPVVLFSIFLLQSHRHSLRRIPHSHRDCNALTVSHRPSRLHTVFSEIRLVKRIEIGEIVLCREGFFLYKVVFGKIHRFIGYKIRCCRQGGHKAEETIFFDKVKYSFLQFFFRYFVHGGKPYIYGINDKLFRFLHGMVHFRFGIFGNCYVEVTVTVLYS